MIVPSTMSQMSEIETGPGGNSSGMIVQVALAREVDHAEAAGEATGEGRDREGDHGRDEERPEGIELVHRQLSLLTAPAAFGLDYSASSFSWWAAVKNRR